MQERGVPMSTDMSAKEDAAPALSRDELVARLRGEFPEINRVLARYDIEKVWHKGSRLRLHASEDLLRPGGTVSGPVIMALADFAMYVAVLSAIGWVPLAVTTNLTINFLKKPAARDLVAEVRLIKLGRRLAVGEIGIRSDG